MATPYKDLKGKKFGRLTAIELLPRSKDAKYRYRYWRCSCECGGEKKVVSSSLQLGHTKSCGCLAIEKKAGINLTGKKFNRLTVLKRTKRPASSKVKDNKSKDFWLCECNCGKQIIAFGFSLRRHRTKSCGCLTNEMKAGNLNGNWKGGRWQTADGYIMIRDKDNPNANRQGYVAEHVMIMSKMLGRQIEKNEKIHHRNGVRDDNTPGNLELWQKSHPPGQRVSDMVEYAKQILVRYSPEDLREPIKG